MQVRLFVSCALIVSSLGCGSSGGEAAPSEPAKPAPAAEPAKPQAAAPEAPKGPAPASIDEATFRLAAEADPTYAADKEAKFRVVLTARGGYHVNPDYPIRIDLTAPSGVTLPKASLSKPDAAAFGEESARFDVSFTAPKGEHQVTANVDFAVCTKETCVPDQRTISLKLPVM